MAPRGGGGRSFPRRRSRGGFLDYRPGFAGFSQFTGAPLDERAATNYSVQESVESAVGYSRKVYRPNGWSGSAEEAGLWNRIQGPHSFGSKDPRVQYAKRRNTSFRRQLTGRF